MNDKMTDQPIISAPDDNDDQSAITVRVDASGAGTRLDKFLALACPDFSRTRLKSLIDNGDVYINDIAATDASLKVAAGMVISFIEPEIIDALPQPENIPLDILYEDDHLLVINKDANMVVHPAAGHHTGTLVNALLYHCGDTLSGIGGVKRPGIVHRLDRGTSGLMMVAKNDKAHKKLAAQLADRSLSRTYDAIAFKIPLPPLGTIDAPIGRHKQHRLKMTIGGADARDAVTHYKVTDRYGGDVASMIECKLQTGRTHQIRVHLASRGHPLIGDPLYGPQDTALRAALKRATDDSDLIHAIMSFPRQALHAREICFIHPKTGEDMVFEAPAPEDLSNLINMLENIPVIT